MSGGPVAYRSRFRDTLLEGFKEHPDFFIFGTIVCAVACCLIVLMITLMTANILDPSPPPEPKPGVDEVDRVVIEIDEVESYYEAGWSYESNAGNGRWVLVRPKNQK